MGFCKTLRFKGFEGLGADLGVVFPKVLIFIGLSMKGVLAFELEEEELERKNLRQPFGASKLLLLLLPLQLLLLGVTIVVLRRCNGFLEERFFFAFGSIFELVL